MTTLCLKKKASILLDILAYSFGRNLAGTLFQTCWKTNHRSVCRLPYTLSFVYFRTDPIMLRSELCRDQTITSRTLYTKDSSSLAVCLCLGPLSCFRFNLGPPLWCGMLAFIMQWHNSMDALTAWKE